MISIDYYFDVYLLRFVQVSYYHWLLWIVFRVLLLIIFECIIALHITFNILFKTNQSLIILLISLLINCVVLNILLKLLRVLSVNVVLDYVVDVVLRWLFF